MYKGKLNKFSVRNNNVAPVGSIAISYHRHYWILFVNSCILFLVHILGRCHQKEKKLLQSNVKMCARKVRSTTKDVSLQCQNTTGKVCNAFRFKSHRMDWIYF